MTEQEQAITKIFGNKLRLRVVGLLLHEDRLLLIRHTSVGQGYLWSPPGGGLDYGESAAEGLKREFAEETGLKISVGKLACVHELLRPPLHAIELFFWVKATGGQLITGRDPEMEKHQQIIQEVAFLPLHRLKHEPDGCVHFLLRELSSWQELYQLNGYYQS